VTRVAVIGVGAMGRHHARVYSEIPHAELVAVVDTDIASAQAVARRLGGRAYADYREMLDKERPEAVTIAVPTAFHRDVALEVVGRGIHLLIEKPIAFSMDEGRQIISAADAAGVRLMIGHIERFNPAVVALKQRLAAGELGRVFQIDARRQGPFPPRVVDVGIVIDLAVHDLDIMRHITGAEVTRVFAETAQQIHATREDSLSGLVRMTNDIIGTLAISWLTPTKIRELQVTGERGMYRVEYLTQDLYFFENAVTQDPGWDTLGVLRGVSEGRMIRQMVVKQEPLRAEQEAFLAAVRGEAPVAVSGADGLRALELAQAVVASGRQHQPVSCST
jgi:UDP-N-acetylglucosamine 3-dehydrogenase